MRTRFSFNSARARDRALADPLVGFSDRRLHPWHGVPGLADLALQIGLLALQAQDIDPGDAAAGQERRGQVVFLADQGEAAAQTGQAAAQLAKLAAALRLLLLQNL